MYKQIKPTVSAHYAALVDRDISPVSTQFPCFVLSVMLESGST